MRPKEKINSTGQREYRGQFFIIDNWKEEDLERLREGRQNTREHKSQKNNTA